MSDNKISKDLKKKLDREIRQYWHNKSKLKQLEQNKFASTRTILLCAERILYVDNVIKKLNTFEMQVFNYIFKESSNCTYCETKYNISKSTYYNIYNKAIYLLAEEWGIM